ncbi:MAG: hypothetical protein AAF621_08490 [Pseudomonadota bacterium]
MNIKRVDPPQGSKKAGEDKSSSKHSKKTEDAYKNALDDIDDDFEDSSSSEADVAEDGDSGEETSSRLSRKGRVITRHKRKINRQALLKQMQKEAIAKQARMDGLKNVGVKRMRTKNDNDSDLSEDEVFEDNPRKRHMSGFAGGGGQDQGDQGQNDDDHSTEEAGGTDEADEVDDIDEIDEDDELVLSENKYAVMQFMQNFIEAPTHTKKQKEMLEKILNSMLQQCLRGMQHFPKTHRKHQALGKSANVCKHALSSLARDNIRETVKLIRIITPD